MESKKKNRKLDPELKRQMKEMEDKQREEALASAEVTIVPPPGQDVEKVSFDQWWMMLNGKKKRRSSLKEVLWAEFKSRGLSKEEAVEAYDNALRLFGM